MDNFKNYRWNLCFEGFKLKKVDQEVEYVL